MPFINTKTTTEISNEKADIIKAKFGKAISLIGKSESWLMLNFEDNCRLYFKGDNSTDIAFVDVSLLGKATDSQYDAFTAEVTKIISEELNIDAGCIYIKYEEVGHWGYNGFNF